MEQANTEKRLPWYGIPAILPYLKEYRTKMVIMVFFGAVSSVADAVFPLFNRYALNHYVGERTLDTILWFALLYIRFVPWAFAFVMGADQELMPATVQRTSTIGARELLRLVFMLAVGRGVIMLGAFLWSLYLNGYTETVFEIQHVWADHLYAGRIISIANKGYAAETADFAGRYLNLLFPPFYSLIVPYHEKLSRVHYNLFYFSQ